jgi:hypothetical protein
MTNRQYYDKAITYIIQAVNGRSKHNVDNAATMATTPYSCIEAIGLIAHLFEVDIYKARKGEYKHGD